MKKNILTMLALCAMTFAPAPIYSQVNDILGEWITVDKNGEEDAVVRIYKATNGKYYGKIVELLVPGSENDVCTQCKDADKDKPILGLIIVRDMDANGNALTGGRILDPKTGKIYYASITYDKGQLILRGSIDKRGLFGENRHWKRKSSK